MRHRVHVLPRQPVRVVIDLRTTSVRTFSKTGRKCRRKKKARSASRLREPTESNVTCHVFLLSDGVAEFEGADLEGIFV